MGPSGEQFGIEISRLLKERHLTQRGLAEHLGVTSATVSYLLHNKLRPSQAHFNGILEYLKADAELMASLKNYWRATRKTPEERSFSNESLFALRCSRGLHLQKVAAGTGIPAERLRQLENQPDTLPEADELRRLKAFYGEEAFAAAGGFVSPPEPKSGFIAEETPSGAKKLPLLTVEIVARAPEKTRFGDFIRGMTLEYRLRRLDESLADRALALLICDTADLHYGVPGTAELLIGDEEPGCRDYLYIGRGARGAVSLFHRRRKHLTYFGFAAQVPRIVATVVFPVLEFKITLASGFTS